MKQAIKNKELEDWQAVARVAIAHVLGWNLDPSSQVEVPPSP